MSIMNKIFSYLHIEINSENTNTKYEKIRKAVEYLNENFTNPNLSISEIAPLSNISEVYFRRIFKEELKCTPSEFISKLRIDRAKFLLESGYRVADVAALSGFNSYSYFTQCFKSKTGVYPAAYTKTLS